LRRLRIGVHAHSAKIVPKARFVMCAQGVRERLAAALLLGSRGIRAGFAKLWRIAHPKRFVRHAVRVAFERISRWTNLEISLHTGGLCTFRLDLPQKLSDRLVSDHAVQVGKGISHHVLRRRFFRMGATALPATPLFLREDAHVVFSLVVTRALNFTSANHCWRPGSRRHCKSPHSNGPLALYPHFRIL
jgi:hypothetical protein